MAVIISPDRIALTEPSGAIRFDTDQRMFTATDFISGSWARPSTTATATSFGRTNVDTTVVQTLATGLHASADTVFGMIRTNWPVTTTNLQAEHIGGTAWRNCNGSIVDVLSCHISHWREGGAVTTPKFEQAFSIYTMYIEAGALKVSERVIMQSMVASSGSTLYSIGRAAGSLDYRVYCGFFL